MSPPAATAFPDFPMVMDTAQAMTVVPSLEEGMGYRGENEINPAIAGGRNKGKQC